jgi:hypothetical protein
MRGRVLASRVVVLALLAVSGCTGIPVEDIRTYDKSFSEAKQAGDLVLDQVAPLIAANLQERGLQKSSSCIVTTEGYPSCFDPLTVLTGGRSGEPAIVLSARAALQMIANYNAALLSLAEGRFSVGSAAQIGDLYTSAKTVLTLISVAVPGVPALFSAATATAFGQLVTGLETIRTVAEERRALTAGAPVVQSMLAELANQTPYLYEIYRASKAREIGRAIVAKDSARQQQIAASVSAYYETLKNYVTVLNATSVGLGKLSEAASGPTHSPQNIRAVIIAAADIKAKADAFWSAARASQN